MLWVIHGASARGELEAALEASLKAALKASFEAPRRDSMPIVHRMMQQDVGDVGDVGDVEDVAEVDVVEVAVGVEVVINYDGGLACHVLATMVSVLESAFFVRYFLDMIFDYVYLETDCRCIAYDHFQLPNYTVSVSVDGRYRFEGIGMGDLCRFVLSVDLSSSRGYLSFVFHSSFIPAPLFSLFARIPVFCTMFDCCSFRSSVCAS